MAQRWRTVRIFISSTFRDMHAERDHLVKVVFPELRERMAARHLYLVDIDLRWGITEQDAEQGKALEICLEEIERSRPFFIGVLGERYGSLLGSLPEDAEFDHPWLVAHERHSLTALEITHAVLRDPKLARRAFFYFRDPRFINEVPKPLRADFATENDEAASKLAALKEEVRGSGRPVFDDYPCHWDAAGGRVGDLDAFGERVLEDLWQAVCAEYPVAAPAPDPLTIEREAHAGFAQERSRLYVGRANEASRLSRYVLGSDRRPAVIAGESGCGKSAFLASWSGHYALQHRDDLLLSYFVGASPSSSDHRRLLRTICAELKRELALEEEIPREDEKLSETLAALLREAAGKRPRIVLVIDALDQLTPLEGAHGLSWLLDSIPEQTRLVVSALGGDCLGALRRRGAEEIALPPLSAEEQRQIVVTLLSEWRRKLDTPQLDALLDHPGVSSPLYLRVALEELRLFGRYEQLLPQIEDLAANVADLFGQVLARLEEDYGRELVTATFSLIGASRYGLSEGELLDLLRREQEEQLPRALWARLARGAKAYVVERGQLISFFHRQLAEAVTTKYPERPETHAKLAAYFARAPLARRLDEYPYQLQKGQDWQALSTALSDLDFLEQAEDHQYTYEWMGYWRSLEGRFDPGACYQTALERRIGSEGESEPVAGSAAVVGSFLSDMGLYPAATPFAERALAIYERALGPDHPQVATSLNNLAALCQSQGDYTGALPLHERALAIRERALGPDHPQVAESLNNLATLYWTQGDYGSALPLYERALFVWDRALGPDHLNVAAGLNNLANLHSVRGDNASALPLCERALAIYERALGPDHPQVARSLDNLAAIYRAEGDYGRALPLCERALAICERALGPDHPQVATSLSHLTVLYEAQGDYGGALALCERALAIRERALGPDHPDVAQSLDNLADLYRAQGDYGGALPLYERALAVSDRALGPDHSQVATSLNNLAALYYEQGDHARALPLYERALDVSERALGPDHPQVAQSLNNLALLYRQRADYARALPLYGRAVAIAEATWGSDNPQTRVLRKNMEACRASQAAQGEGDTQTGPASGSVGEDSGELARVLNSHLQRIRTNYPELDAFLDQYFGDADVAKIAAAAGDKLDLTLTDGEQHSTVLERGEVVYHITTLPVDMGQAREWFGRAAGGYTTFLGDVWDSLLPKTTASVWCHVIYGSSAGQIWVHMAMCAVRQPAPIGVLVMPVELLTPEEREAVGV